MLNQLIAEKVEVDRLLRQHQAKGVRGLAS
jgi:hypothetical protein